MVSDSFIYRAWFGLKISLKIIDWIYHFLNGGRFLHLISIELSSFHHKPHMEMCIKINNSDELISLILICGLRGLNEDKQTDSYRNEI